MSLFAVAAFALGYTPTDLCTDISCCDTYKLTHQGTSFPIPSRTTLKYGENLFVQKKDGIRLNMRPSYFDEYCDSSTADYGYKLSHSQTECTCPENFDCVDENNTQVAFSCDVKSSRVPLFVGLGVLIVLLGGVILIFER